MNIPQKLRSMQPATRWKWFDKQLEILNEAAEKGQSVKMSVETVEAFAYLLNRSRLMHAESVVMHNNAVATIGAALVEQDEEMSRDRLRHAMEIAGDATYSMFDDAQDYFDRNALPFPDTLEEHRNNIKAQKANQEADEQKYQEWYAQNCAPLLGFRHDL